MRPILPVAPLLASLLALSMAQAQSYDLGLNHTTAQGFGVHLEASEVPWRGNLLSIGVSDRAVDVGLRRNLPLKTVGTLGLNLTGAYAYAGGGRLGLDLSGSVGPVALGASLSGWTTAVSNLTPLEVWSLRGADLRGHGAQLDAQARYRLRRDLILSAAAQLPSGAAQPVASLGAEWRREALSYRLGAQLGVPGVTGGLSYRSDTLTLSGDLFVGKKLGFSAQLDAPAALPVGRLSPNPADVSAYLVYQPWRENVAQWRYGLGLSLPTSEQNTWRLRVLGGTGGHGLELGWRHTSP